MSESSRFNGFFDADYARLAGIQRAEKLLDVWQIDDTNRNKVELLALELIEQAKKPINRDFAFQVASVLEMEGTNHVALSALSRIKAYCHTLAAHPETPALTLPLNAVHYPIPENLKVPMRNHPDLVKRAKQEAGRKGRGRLLLALEQGSVDLHDLSMTPRRIAERVLDKQQETVYGRMFLHSSSVIGIDLGLTYTKARLPDSYLIIHQFNTPKSLRNSVVYPQDLT